MASWIGVVGMKMHGGQNASKEAVTRHHLFDELTGGTGCIDGDATTDCDRRRMPGTEHTGVQAWPGHGRVVLRPDGIEEAADA